MCTTRRYLFLCSHPATHRFRNTLCESPSVRGCKVHDFNVYLRCPCKKCANRGMPSVHMPTPEIAFNDTWHIPSRCFVDVGYRTLNPFHEDKSSEPCTPISPIEPPIPQQVLTPPVTPVKDDKNVYKRLIRRLTLRKKAGPCCAKEAQAGAFLAVRLEGREQRMYGRIQEDRCESPF